jgi:telomerase reverse transcriptase
MGKKRKRPARLLDGETSLPCKRRKGSGHSRAALTHEHPVLSRYYPRLVTLRQYLLEQLPESSKARRRRIAGLGRDPNAKTNHALGQRQITGNSNDGDNVCQIMELLDSTLVGILQQSSPAVTEDRQRGFAVFTQSEERSILCTDTGPTSLQSEVRRCAWRDSGCIYHI